MSCEKDLELYQEYLNTYDVFDKNVNIIIQRLVFYVPISLSIACFTSLTLVGVVSSIPLLLLGFYNVSFIEKCLINKERKKFHKKYPDFDMSLSKENARLKVKNIKILSLEPKINIQDKSEKTLTREEKIEYLTREKEFLINSTTTLKEESIQKHI